MSNQWFLSYIVGLNTTTVEYAAPMGAGDQLYNVSQGRHACPCPANGSLLTMHVDLSAAPGTGKSFRFQVTVATVVSTTLDVTISDSAVTGTATGTVAVTAGQKLDIKITPTGTPTSGVRASIWFEWAPTVANEFIYMGGLGGNQWNGSAALFLPVFSGQINTGTSISADGAFARSIVSFPGTITAFYACMVTSPSTQWNLVLTKNSVEEASSALVISGASTTGNVTGLSIACTTTDTLSFKNQTGPGTNNTRGLNFGIVFKPTTSGYFCWSMQNDGGGQSETTVTYGRTLNSNTSEDFDATEANVQIASPTSISVIGFTTEITSPADPRGTGGSETIRFRKNGADGNGYTVFDDDVTLKKLATGSADTLVQGDLFNFSLTPAGDQDVPGAMNITLWGLIGQAPNPDQYRLMLAEDDDPDIPTLNITPHNAGENQITLVKFERGKSRAVLGEPPAAGMMSAIIENPAMGRYGLDEPTVGLAMRLNKKWSPSDDWYHMCQVNLRQPRHQMQNRRFMTAVEAMGYGPLTKLSGKRVSSPLYKNITTGQAVGYLLDAAGFPSFMRDIDDGEVTLLYWWLNDEDAMSALNKITASEGITAEYLERGDGTFCWRGRSARYTDTESAAIQTTFTSQGSEPRLTDFEYFPGGDEIVNYASHERVARHDDSAPSVVWEDAGGAAGAGNYILLPNEEFVLLATAEEPFFDAITPVLGVDYDVGLGTVTVALERDSGQRTKITFTAGAGGATIGGVGADNITLRATTTIRGFDGFDGIFFESSKVDADTSIEKYGFRPWTGEMSKEMNWYDMRDNLDAIVTWKMNPTGRIRFSLLAHRGATANETMAKRDLGHRIRVVETDFDFDGECWIERMEHTVNAPAGPVTGPEVGYELMVYECTVISVAGGSEGSGVGEDNPYDSIDNSGNVLDGDLTDQTPATYGILAGAGI